MFDLELKKYRAGLYELLWQQPLLGKLARALGEPIFSVSNSTAWVTYDCYRRDITFAFNPNFIINLTDEEVAAVIAHEMHHVILHHLEELRDKKLFPDKNILVKAQECVINDTLENIYALSLPQDALRGPETVGFDCSPYSSKQVYDMLKKNQESQEELEAPSGCSGIVIEDKAIYDFQKSFERIVQKVADDTNQTPEEVLEGVTPGGTSFSFGDVSKSAMRSDMSTERVNWQELLAKVNPKVLDSGIKKENRKTNWTKNNRRMGSVYPNVILPVTEPQKPKGDDKGESLPTFIIALDLSYSIPRELVKDLQNLLEDIPSNLIRAFPCTWSDDLVVYDENKEVCKSYGTNIRLVVDYAKQIKQETSVYPYVLVITDGHFFDHLPNLISQELIKKWFIMAIETKDFDKCADQVGDENTYFLKDFKIRKTALCSKILFSLLLTL